MNEYKKIESIFVKDIGYIYSNKLPKISDDDFLPRYNITITSSGWYLCENNEESFAVNHNYVIKISYFKN